MFIDKHNILILRASSSILPLPITCKNMDTRLVIGCIIFGIILNFQVANCISCFHCNGAEHVSDCMSGASIKLCPPEETCYMEKRINLETAKDQYYAGCINIKLCHLDSCQKAVFGDAHSRAIPDLLPNQFPVCTACCYDDNCNYGLCGANSSEIPSNITQCFNCKGMHDESICSETIDCDLKLKNCLVMKTREGNFDLECINKRQCGILLQLPDVENETRCCETHLCNGNPKIPKLDKESILKNFSCPPNLARPTTTATTPTTTTATTTPTATTTATTTTTTTTIMPTATTTTATTPTTTPTTPGPSTTSPPQTTSPTTTATVPTTTTTATTPATTTTATTPTTISTTPFLETVAQSTAPPPKTLSPEVTTSCAVCAGPDFLCEKLFAPTPCPAPDNYCINTVINHKDGTRTVDRKCGDFDTCYREWFQGSSDDDKCRQFDENNEQRLDFQCTYCCTTDDCNIPLRPDGASLYKPA